eukprot:scaffold23438_cov50-Attheya_sp.AAC.4
MAAADLREKELKKLQADIAKGNDDDSDDDELEDTEGLEAELKELAKSNDARQATLDEYEKNKKWNIDNMCKVVEERTIINPRAAQEKFSEAGYALPDDDDDDTKGTPDVGKDVDVTSMSIKDDDTEKPKPKEPTASEASKTVAPSSKPKKIASAKTTTVVAKKKAVAGPDRESVAMMTYHDFTQKYADLVEEFMLLQNWEASKQFLLLHGNVLLQENASNYLLLASLEDEMNGFREKMKLTARQSQIISNIAELAKSLHTHPGNVILPFFQRLEQPEFLLGFQDGVNSFIEKIKARAIVKKEEIDAERKEELEQEAQEAVDLKEVPKEERVGPGGLDPVEVFETLPLSMQEAFESREVDDLKKAIMEMEPEEAEYHMKRCVDCGLWNA